MTATKTILLSLFLSFSFLSVPLFSAEDTQSPHPIAEQAEDAAPSQPAEAETLSATPEIADTTVEDATRDLELPKMVDQKAEAIVNAASKAVGNVGSGMMTVFGEDSVIAQFFSGSLTDAQHYMQEVFNVVRQFWWLILPIFFLVGGLFLGGLFERFVLTRLKSFTRTTRWLVDDIIVDELGQIIRYLITIAGTYGFLLSVPINQGLYDNCVKTLEVCTVLLITVYIKRTAVSLFSLYSKETRQIFSSSSIVNNVVIITIYAFGALVMCATLNINITPILTALGVGGLAVALALQETLTNLFAGIQIILSKQLKPGDYIRLATGEEGYVVDITWRNTMVRQLPNNMNIIPNAKLAACNVINFYQPEREMAVPVDLGVSYDSDLKHVEKVTIEVAREVMKEVPGGIPDFDPVVRFTAFADFSINFTTVLRAREFVDQFTIKHEFIKRLHRRYQKEGIIIPFPVRTIQYKEEASSALKTRQMETVPPFPEGGDGIS